MSSFQNRPPIAAITSPGVKDFVGHIAALADVEVAETFGYTMFFVGPQRKLPFATIADSDNEHDNVSRLHRPGVFRLNIGVSKATFEMLLENRPSAEGVDFAELDRVLPHPHYAAQHYVCVLNPEKTLNTVLELLAEARDIAAGRASRNA